MTHQLRPIDIAHAQLEQLHRHLRHDLERGRATRPDRFAVATLAAQVAAAGHLERIATAVESAAVDLEYYVWFAGRR